MKPHVLPFEDASSNIVFDMIPFDDVEKAQYSHTEEGKSTSSMMIPNIGTNWGCINEPGPDPLDCPPLFSEWSSAVKNEKSIQIPGGSCFTMKRSTCEALVCAPGISAEVDWSLAEARMMNPCQTTCAVNGKGGHWGNEDSSVLVIVKRADE
nr:uncharacterized protein CTRU02_14368 [Colletotrichum truncatum]KAF6782329.1 hypothetical protein CTRU02_14368 [Colletotrichum truncatum]